MTGLLPPPPSPDSAAFYAAAVEGRFLLPRCEACGRAHWYPRPLCPFCFGSAQLEPASGRGLIYSVSVMRRASPPFAIAYVALEEGPKMLTHIVDCDLGALSIGMPVTVTFKPTDGGPPVPCFRPDAVGGTGS